MGFSFQLPQVCKYFGEYPQQGRDLYVAINVKIKTWYIISAGVWCHSLYFLIWHKIVNSTFWVLDFTDFRTLAPDWVSYPAQVISVSFSQLLLRAKCTSSLTVAYKTLSILLLNFPEPGIQNQGGSECAQTENHELIPLLCKDWTLIYKFRGTCVPVILKSLALRLYHKKTSLTCRSEPDSSVHTNKWSRTKVQAGEMSTVTHNSNC